MASLDDILTATKNVVTAINNASQTYFGIQGAQSKANITSATLVKTGVGRVAMVSIISGGSVAGQIYDTNSTSSTANPIFTIPTTLGVIFLNMPVSNGIVVKPGTGQAVTISYS